MTKILFTLSSALILSACVVPHPYTSKEYQKYQQSDLQIPSQPYVVKLETEFARNGNTMPAVTPMMAEIVKQALTDSKIAIPSNHARYSLKLYGNNIANIGNAAAQGFKTGLTLGLAGSTVQDYYQFYCTYSDDRQQLSRTDYNHSIVTTIGASTQPIGLIPHASLDQAFRTVTKEIVINCLGDLQKQGYLLPQPKPASTNHNP